MLVTTCAKRCNESMSWRMFDWRFVIKTMYNSSSGWYTNRTLSCSTVVCCVPESASLGKPASRASIRDRCISRNCLERTAFPPRVQIDAARTTWAFYVSIAHAYRQIYTIPWLWCVVSRSERTIVLNDPSSQSGCNAIMAGCQWPLNWALRCVAHDIGRAGETIRAALADP